MSLEIPMCEVNDAYGVVSRFVAFLACADLVIAYVVSSPPTYPYRRRNQERAPPRLVDLAAEHDLCRALPRQKQEHGNEL